MDAVRGTHGATIARTAIDLITAAERDEPAHAVAVLAELLRAAGARVRIDHTTGRPIVLAELGGSQGPIYTVQWHGHLDSPMSIDQGSVLDNERLCGRGVAGMKGAIAAMVAACAILARADAVGRTQRVLMTFHGEMLRPYPAIDDLITSNFYGDVLLSGCTCHISGTDIAPDGSTWYLPTNAPGELRWQISASGADAERREVGDPTLVVGRALIEAMQAAAALGRTAPAATGLRSPQIGTVDGVVAGWRATGGLRYSQPGTPASLAELLGVVADGLRSRGVSEVDTRLDLIEPPYRVAEDEPLLEAVRDARRVLGDTEMTSRELAEPVFLGRFTDRARMPSTVLGADPSSIGTSAESITVDDLATLAHTYAIATWTYLEAVTD